MNSYPRVPHVSGASHEGSTHNAALLIDFDNVTMGIRSNLGHELRKLLDSDIIAGKVAVQRAYADWRRYPQYIVPLAESSIDLIFAPAYGSSRKNATDIRLAIDATELVFTRPEIGTYILLSGDSDFSSLVLKLKEYGKYVIGVGLQESSSDILVQNCDEYYSYNSLSGLTAASDMDQLRMDPWELVERAIHRMAERKDVMRSDRLKQVMLELDPTFDEKSTGFSKFNRFLAEAAHRELIVLRKAPNGQYEVAPGRRKAGEPGADEAKEEIVPPPPPPSRERKKRRPPREESVARSEPHPPIGDAATSLRTAYRSLAETVGELATGRESVRDSEVKRALVLRDKKFDETALGFRKFSRFLQQARDEGVIDLKQGEDGNFYLSPVEGSSVPGPSETPAVSPDGDREAGGRETSSRGRSPRRGRKRRSGPREDAQEPAAEDSAPGLSAPEPAEPEPEEPAAALDDGGAPSEAKPADARTGRSDRRGLGRFRRGSRGAPPASKSTTGSRPKIGPIDVPADAAPADAPSGSKASDPAESASGSDRSEERATGGHRMGSRGRSSAKPKTSDREAAAKRPEPKDDAVQPDDTGAIAHMVQNYSGVGKRTAERLVSEFGDRIFQVIDNEPERISRLLPRRQAEAVLSARRAELESNG